jgi:hypothetical protein
VQAIGSIRVARARIADDLGREFWSDRGTIGGDGRPRQCDANETAIQQQGVRRGRRLREARAVRSVDRSEQGIASLRGVPPLANALDRQAHATAWLVAGDARAPIRPERLEERMSLGVERPIGVQHGDGAVRVVVTGDGRESFAAAGIPPASNVTTSALGTYCGADQSEHQADKNRSFHLTPDGVEPV